MSSVCWRVAVEKSCEGCSIISVGCHGRGRNRHAANARRTTKYISQRISRGVNRQRKDGSAGDIALQASPLFPRLTSQRRRVSCNAGDVSKLVTGKRISCPTAVRAGHQPRDGGDQHDPHRENLQRPYQTCPCQHSVNTLFTNFGIYTSQKTPQFQGFFSLSS